MVSPIPPQRGQMNTCRIVCSSAIRADLDQAISALQAWQIGVSNFSNDRCILSIGGARRDLDLHPVCTENLSSGVVVVKSAQEGV
jgi:hypothetical protein